MTSQRWTRFLTCLAIVAQGFTSEWVNAKVGVEVAVPRHLQDGEEFEVSKRKLIAHGEKLFTANWTDQEGGGRPLTKGTGGPLSDPTNPLVFPRNNNRISAPDANSCAGCHNAPFGVAGGGGDFVTSVFVLGQRFDFATFDQLESPLIPTKGAVDENHQFVNLQSIANRRATLGMQGSGFVEMLARQMTADLQSIRDATDRGQSHTLVTKGVFFGKIARDAAGNWDTAGVEGLPAPSLATTGPDDPPNLIIRPFHQAGAVVSIRQFTNNAFNHHHGIQSTERFGVDTDPDGDGFVNELTRADVTASAIHQATLAVPGRVIPNDREIEKAVWVGEKLFDRIGCAECHIPNLPLDDRGWVYTEPNPFNPEGNLQEGDVRPLRVDLTSHRLPRPRLKVRRGVVRVPAFTDLKLHDITSGPDDPNREALDMNAPAGSDAFLAGNGRFITKKLWGIANEPPFFHHGQFTTMRQSVLAHSGEALESRENFERLGPERQGAIIEFLKTLQNLPPGTKHLIVDEHGRKKAWPPHGGRDPGDDHEDDED